MPRYVLPVASYERERFCAQSVDEAYAMLCHQGVAVLPRVLAPERIQPTVDALLEVLRTTFPGFDPADAATYQHLRNHGLVHGMLVQTHGVGWSQPVVDLRQDPAIVDRFARLWSLHLSKEVRPEALFSSADGIAAYFNAPDLRGGFRAKDDDWLHWDRAPADAAAWSVQSFINLLPPQEAAFHCLPGSHADQADFAARFPATHAKRFHLLDSQDQVDFFLVGERAREHICIAAEPGDMVLWDSRTIHAARPPLRHNPAPGKRPRRSSSYDDDALRRLVVYVSMQPKALARPIDLERKRRAFAQLRSTTHNAASGVELFGRYQRVRCERDSALKDASRPIAEPPRLTPLGRSLFGLCADESD